MPIVSPNATFPTKEIASLIKGICLGKMMVFLPLNEALREFFSWGEKVAFDFWISYWEHVFAVISWGCINWGMKYEWLSYQKGLIFISHDSQGSWEPDTKLDNQLSDEHLTLSKNGRKHWHHLYSKLTNWPYQGLMTRSLWCLLTFSQIESRFLTAFRCDTRGLNVLQN